MTGAEYVAWRMANRECAKWQQADSPCIDCTAEYRAEMAGEGLCDVVGPNPGYLIPIPTLRKVKP